jgi:hypothetical protein
MRNVAPSRALVRRANDLKSLAFVVATLGVFIIAVGVLLTAIPFAAPTSPNYGTYQTVLTLVWILGIVFLLVALGMVIRAFTWRTDNDLAMITGRVLEPQLDDRFTLIRNVSKRQIGYVDAVLVGPPGVLVFRILDNNGVFANDGVNWMERDARGEFRVARIRPTAECIADIRKIREYLAAHNLPDVPVFGVVVFVKDPSYVQLMAQNPTVPITHLSQIVPNLATNYLAMDRIDARVSDVIVRLLFR